MTRHRISVAAALVGLSLNECTKPPSSSVTLFVTSSRPADRNIRLGPDTGMTIVLGKDTLFVQRVEAVVRDAEIAPSEAGDCAGNAEEDEAACPQLSAGPLLLRVPLGTAPESSLTVPVRPGRYTLLQFQIQMPDPKRDSAFVSAHPEFGQASIRFLGTFSQAGRRTAVSYALPFNEREQLELDPPLTVAKGGTARMTLRVDLTTWFQDAKRTALVDPASAAPGQPHESLVRDNIRMSLNAYHDDTLSAP